MIKSDILEILTESTRELKENKETQSAMRKKLQCMEIPYDTLMINKNFHDGNDMLESVAKLALDLFDITCDNYINKMTIANIVSTMLKIENQYDKINTTLKNYNSQIKDEYLQLKLQQCGIQKDILFYTKQQKEIEQTEREIIKEQLREEKQLQKEKEKLEKEKTALQYKFNKELEKTGQQNEELKESIENIEAQIQEKNYALTHNRSGYVYVVSNNDMKDGQYKIGITRRTIEERMKELGSGASHSFGMNVHGYVYCDDCFEVESKLHKYFANQRINQINPRKEWFKTTLEDITKAFKTLFDIDIVLNDVSDENYLYSKEKVSI